MAEPRKSKLGAFLIANAFNLITLIGAGAGMVYTIGRTTALHSAEEQLSNERMGARIEAVEKVVGVLESATNAVKETRYTVDEHTRQIGAIQGDIREIHKDMKSQSEAVTEIRTDIKYIRAALEK